MLSDIRTVGVFLTSRLEEIDSAFQRSNCVDHAIGADEILKGFNIRFMVEIERLKRAQNHLLLFSSISNAAPTLPRQSFYAAHGLRNDRTTGQSPQKPPHLPSR